LGYTLATKLTRKVYFINIFCNRKIRDRLSTEKQGLKTGHGIQVIVTLFSD